MRTRLLAILALGVFAVFASLDAVAAPPPPGTCDVTALMSSDRPMDTHLAVMAVLSPRMPQTLIEWPRMAAVARREGLGVMTFRDPRVPLDEWRAAVSSANAPSEYVDAPPMNLDIAQRCQLLNHSPAMLVARCGRAHPWPIFGVMPDAGWTHVLRARRVELERMPCP